MAKANETSSARNSFIRVPGNRASGTHFFEEIAIAPASVVRCFGRGGSGDGFKVSRQWAFCKGELVFTLYDWKCTSLYDPDFWSPEELWQSDWPFDLHVGSKEPANEKEVAEFIAFIQQTASKAE